VQFPLAAPGRDALTPPSCGLPFFLRRTGGGWGGTLGAALASLGAWQGVASQGGGRNFSVTMTAEGVPGALHYDFHRTCVVFRAAWP